MRAREESSLATQLTAAITAEAKKVRATAGLSESYDFVEISRLLNLGAIAAVDVLDDTLAYFQEVMLKSEEEAVSLVCAENFMQRINNFLIELF